MMVYGRVVIDAAGVWSCAYVNGEVIMLFDSDCDDSYNLATLLEILTI